MKRPSSKLTGIFIIALISYVAWFFWWAVLPGPKSPLLGYDRKMQAQYDKLTIGMQFEEVIVKLGKQPKETITEFGRSEYKVFGEEFIKTNNTSTTVLYLWVNGGNWYYCIGFDKNGQLTAKGEGHS